MAAIVINEHDAISKVQSQVPFRLDYREFDRYLQQETVAAFGQPVAVYPPATLKGSLRKPAETLRFGRMEKG